MDNVNYSLCDEGLVRVLDFFVVWLDVYLFLIYIYGYNLCIFVCGLWIY